MKDLFVIAGPCVIEDEAVVMETASELERISKELGVEVIFKASFDKANRSSHRSFRGLDFKQSLDILGKVKSKTGLKVTTDVHETIQIDPVAEVVDVIQIPALLCRQTDLILKVAETGLTINVKKGQFMAPSDMKNVIKKILTTNNENIYITERGTTFGYNNLVVDFRSFAIMREFGYPIIFDATHSVQLPGAGGEHSLGQRQYVPHLAKAAAACGIDGVFLEVHPEPEKALSDGPNMVPLSEVKKLLGDLIAIHNLAGNL